MRHCVYTSLYGTFDTLPEQPQASPECDYIAFVGDPAITSDTWQVRHVPPLLPGDPVRSSRFAKLLAHRLLPDYGASLYIDCSVRLEQPAEALFRDLLTGHTDTMACFRHPDRTDVLSEAEAVIALGYDDPAVCMAQMAAYRRAGFTGRVPLIWGGLLLRYHHHPAVVACMERWFVHVLRYSRRDQLSFPFVAEQLDFDFVAHPHAATRSAWHSWPHRVARRRSPYHTGACARSWEAADRMPTDLAALAQVWRTADDRVDGLAAAVRTAHHAADAQAAAFRATQRVASALETALHTTQQALQQAETMLAAVAASSSWRITRPFRAVAGFVRRLCAG